MSQENVDAVRRSHQAVQRGDWAAAVAPMAHDVIWDDTYLPTGGISRGHDGVRAATRSWMGTWERQSYQLGFSEYIAVGDKVFARGWETGRGKNSGAEVTMDHFQVWTFSVGKAIEIKLFGQAAPALAAVGLSE